MARFLLPVDYSKVSANALKYLLEATKPDDQIDLLHVNTGMVNLAEAPLIQNFQQSEAANRQQMVEYFTEALSIDTLPEHCNVKVETGEVVSTIVGQSKKSPAYDRIVMGTRDKYDLFDKWLGTISLGVVKRSDIPVLLVPLKAIYQTLDNCIVAGDRHLCEENNLGQIADWNKEYKSFLHFVHVSNGPDPEFLETLERVVKQYYEDNEVEFGYDITKVSSDSVAEVLMEYAKKFNSQLIIILPEKQHFLNALLVRSVSKDLILHSAHPVLFLK